MFWIGIGCRRGTSKQLIETAIAEVLDRHHVFKSAIVGLATADFKSNEPGLLEYCQDYNLPLRYFSAAELRAIVVPNPSDAVAQLGTFSVAEAAAMCAAKTDALWVSKQVMQKTVTIAIAQVPTLET